MARYIPNPTLEARIGASTQLRVVLQRKADAVMNAAKSSSPVRTAHYINGFKAITFIEDRVWVGRVLNTDFKAWWIEMGTATPLPTPKYRVLGRALDVARSA